MGKYPQRSRKANDQGYKQVNRYAPYLDGAFRYWVAMARWKADRPAICSNYGEKTQDSHGYGLYLLESKEVVYRSQPMMYFNWETPITKNAWNKVGKALSENVEVPIWEEYLSRAAQDARIDNQRGLIINLAIAIESCARALVDSLLLPNPNPEVLSQVSRIGFSNILRNWKKFGFKQKRWSDISREQGLVLHIIERRNRLMHRGNLQSMSKDREIELFDAARTFIRLSGKELEAGLTR